jgi:hypothetical protein
MHYYTTQEKMNFFFHSKIKKKIEKIIDRKMSNYIERRSKQYAMKTSFINAPDSPVYLIGILELTYQLVVKQNEISINLRFECNFPKLFTLHESNFSAFNAMVINLTKCKTIPC